MKNRRENNRANNQVVHWHSRRVSHFDLNPVNGKCLNFGRLSDSNGVWQLPATEYVGVAANFFYYHKFARHLTVIIAKKYRGWRHMCCGTNSMMEKSNSTYFVCGTRRIAWQHSAWNLHGSPFKRIYCAWICLSLLRNYSVAYILIAVTI